MMRVAIRSLAIIYCLLSGFLWADQITVNNMTDQTIYAATYKQKNNLLTISDAQRTDGPVAIKPGESMRLSRPDRQIGYDRELAFFASSNVLGGTINVRDFNKVPHTNSGDKQGSTFYIADEKGQLKGFNAVEWKVVQPALRELHHVKQETIKTITAPAKDLIKGQLAELRDYPHKNDVARVRVGNELCDSEKAYRALRDPYVRTALEKFLGRSLKDAKKVPVIALVESGGGYRAMTCSLGWHVGASTIGLMDAVTYMVGLSGSTWSIGLWVASGLSIAQFKEQLLSLMGGLQEVSPDEFKLMANSWLVKTVFNQELTLVDLYAGLLSNALLKPFGNKRQRMYLSEQANAVAQGHMPLPLYTAVRAEDRVTQDWYEFSPYEIGASWLGMYVPSWAYGRKFTNGVSVDFAPEQSFGFQMGTFGSAFAASVEQIINELISEDSLPSPLDTIVDALLDRIGQERITRAKINNFTADMPTSVLKNAEQLALVDAGVAFNLAYPPVSGERPERKADIIIFLDASGGQIGADLKKVESYARAKNLAFPAIDYTGIDAKVVSIFKDENDSTVPLVIYLPRVMDVRLFNALSAKAEYKDFGMLRGFDIQQCLSTSYCNTSNFNYAPDQVRQLSAMTEFNIRASADAIKEAIDWKVKQMNGDSEQKEQQSSQPAQPTKPIQHGPVMGAAAGDGYFWNNPPFYQVKCDNGAQLQDEQGKPCTFMSKHCACVCPAGKRLNPLRVEKHIPGVQRAHWGCR